MYFPKRIQKDGLELELLDSSTSEKLEYGLGNKHDTSKPYVRLNYSPMIKNLCITEMFKRVDNPKLKIPNLFERVLNLTSDFLDIYSISIKKLAEPSTCSILGKLGLLNFNLDELLNSNQLLNIKTSDDFYKILELSGELDLDELPDLENSPFLKKLYSLGYCNIILSQPDSEHNYLLGKNLLCEGSFDDEKFRSTGGFGINYLTAYK